MLCSLDYIIEDDDVIIEAYSNFFPQEDLLIHGDSVYDVIDKQDQQAVRTELARAPADGEDRVFLCRMNVARNARRQMRFGDQKVSE